MGVPEPREGSEKLQGLVDLHLLLHGQHQVLSALGGRKEKGSSDSCRRYFTLVAQKDFMSLGAQGQNQTNSPQTKSSLVPRGQSIKGGSRIPL